MCILAKISVLCPLNFGSYANRPHKFFLNVQPDTLNFLQCVIFLLTIDEKLTEGSIYIFVKVQEVNLYIFKV